MERDFAVFALGGGKEDVGRVGSLCLDGFTGEGCCVLDGVNDGGRFRLRGGCSGLRRGVVPTKADEYESHQQEANNGVLVHE